MKLMLSAFFFCLLTLGQLAAKTVEFEATFDPYSEYAPINKAEAKSEGWVVKKNQYGEEVYFLKEKIDVKKLPYHVGLGEAYLSISKKGELSFGISVGDADSSADTKLKLPQKNGTLLSLPAPLEVSCSGGDAASGTWYINAHLKIQVKD